MNDGYDIHGELEKKLDDFDPAVRRQALLELSGRAAEGKVFLPPFSEEVNVHCHTFFSFNAYGYSPSGFAWRARRKGLAVAGIVDFDVLHGLEEILECGDILGMRTTGGVESRVFIKEYADKELNSPKEPGIAYFMGTAFSTVPPRGSQAESVLNRMWRLAQERNRAVIRRVNGYLGDVTLDYEKDVAPLAPSGNPTERHIVIAYADKAKKMCGGDLERFWAKALALSGEEVAGALHDLPGFYGMIRNKLMKYGAPGYVTPDAGSFPALEEMIAMVKEAGGLPTCTWLDGTSEGERDPGALLDFMLEKGAVVNNFIPDRNWNLPDPEVKKRKLANLHGCIEACRERGIPVIAGTEMNKYGQPFVDQFSSSELAPFARDFFNGALLLYGHTAAARLQGRTYFSDWALDAFGDPYAFEGRRKRNGFYSALGAGGPYNAERLEKAAALPSDATPQLLLEVMAPK